MGCSTCTFARVGTSATVFGPRLDGRNISSSSTSYTTFVADTNASHRYLGSHLQSNCCHFLPFRSSFLPHGKRLFPNKRGKVSVGPPQVQEANTSSCGVRFQKFSQRPCRFRRAWRITILVRPRTKGEEVRCPGQKVPSRYGQGILRPWPARCRRMPGFLTIMRCARKRSG